MTSKWLKRILWGEKGTWEYEGYVRTDERKSFHEVVEEREKGRKIETTHCRVWRHPDTGDEKYEDLVSTRDWDWYDD